MKEKLIFKEPLYWKISHSSEIEQHINWLSDVIRGRKEISEYLSAMEPCNYDKDVNLTYEGFVFYRSFGEYYDYSKIKTQEFYKTHKYRERNIQYLITLH